MITTFPRDRVSGLNDKFSELESKIESITYKNPYKDQWHCVVIKDWPTGSVCRSLWSQRSCSICEHRLLAHSGHVVGIQWDSGEKVWWTAVQVYAELLPPIAMDL